MSLTSLSAAFANRYSKRLVRVDVVGMGPEPSSAAGAGASSPADSLKTLTDYIPSEILTLYIAAIAAVVKWTFKPASDEIVYLGWIFWICLLLTPIWAFFGVLLQSQGKPPWKAFLWPMVAGPIAFAAYAYAIPGSWLAASHVNGGLFATLLLLIMPVFLHGMSLIYTRLLPPT